MFWKQLYPKKVIPSVYGLDWEKLSKSYGGVIFDIDNTLVPQDWPADEKAIRLFEEIHALGMKTMLVSNNREPRVKAFAQKVKTGYIYSAGKPGKRGYETAMKRMGTVRTNTLFIGDQIFSDIWGANRVGMDTILTEPIDRTTDEIQVVIKRLFEIPFRREAGGVGSCNKKRVFVKNIAGMSGRLKGLQLFIPASKTAARFC